MLIWNNNAAAQVASGSPWALGTFPTWPLRDAATSSRLILLTPVLISVGTRCEVENDARLFCSVNSLWYTTSISRRVFLTVFEFGVSEIRLGLNYSLSGSWRAAPRAAPATAGRVGERLSHQGRPAAALCPCPALVQLFPSRLGASARPGLARLVQRQELLGHLSVGSVAAWGPVEFSLAVQLPQLQHSLVSQTGLVGKDCRGNWSELDTGALVCRHVSVLLHKYQAANWPSESGSHQHQKSMDSNGSDQVI